ncbi:MAG: MazG nucleotide pyrophosphohydrolase domain-containing protein [Candidatus Muiribacteriota bacterium]
MQQLLDIMKKLRSENGCPWDREQTFDSLREFLIEEAYELEQAIREGNEKEHCEELGDLLLQIAFQCVIAEEENLFNYNDVESGICHKLIERHPHVFGQQKVNTSEDVLKIWNKNKKKKKGSVISGIPENLPSLMKASKVIKRLKNLDENHEFHDKTTLNFDINQNNLGEILFKICLEASNQNLNPEDELNKYIKNACETLMER